MGSRQCAENTVKHAEKRAGDKAPRSLGAVRSSALKNQPYRAIVK